MAQESSLVPVVVPSNAPPLPFAGEPEARRRGELPRPTWHGPGYRDGALLEFTVEEGDEEVVLGLEVSEERPQSR